MIVLVVWEPIVQCIIYVKKGHINPIYSTLLQVIDNNLIFRIRIKMWAFVIASPVG